MMRDNSRPVESAIMGATITESSTWSCLIRGSNQNPGLAPNISRLLGISFQNSAGLVRLVPVGITTDQLPRSRSCASGSPPGSTGWEQRLVG